MKLLATLLLLAPLTLTAQTPQAPAAAQDAMPAKPPVPPSHSLTVIVNGHATRFSVEDLLNLPQVTVHVHNAHRNADEDYTGPLVSDVLAKAGLTSAHENEQQILHSAVIATATDNYYVLYSAAEMEPAFSNSKVIIAVMKGNGMPDAEGGNIQLINTDGAKPARWVHGLTTLTVMPMSRN